MPFPEAAFAPTAVNPVARYSPDGQAAAGAALVVVLRAHLTPGGHLCLADLDLDDGEFHADNTGVCHFGFERGALRQMFVDAGFTAVNDVTATAITRPTTRGVERTFTIFMMHGIAN